LLLSVLLFKTIPFPAGERDRRIASLETYAEYIFDKAELLIVQEKTILCIFTEKGGE
jgi:hypothetical protein